MERFLLKNQFLFSILLLTITFLSMSFKLASAIDGNETDRLALLALKQHLLSADSPGPLLSWNASLHFCDWHGILCNRNRQRVIRLELGSLELATAGTISASIGNLSSLQVANLSYNNLQGTIPREIGYLKNLRLLDLSNNNLHGNIPTELNNCSNLQEINLDLNLLTGIIPFGSGVYDPMKNLTSLSLSSNNFSGGIPSSLANLSSLDFLQLSRNQLGGIIPNDLSRLSNLQNFVISRNNLSGLIPSSIYNLSSLIYIDIGLNRLSGELAPEIGFSFPKLEVLYIGGNQFTGRIPRSLANVSSLAQLDINSNGFSGSVPENLGKLQNFTLLSLDYNHLGTGEDGDLDFVSSLTNCSSLSFLAIYVNRFGGVLPDSVANLSSQIDFLHMGGNQITGNIPEGIGNLVELTLLYLGVNSFTGNFPSSIAKLHNLVRLDISANRLTGTIPSSIGNLSQLSYLNLDGNNFEGRIPLTLGNCRNMMTMDLSGNKFHGALSNQLIGAFDRLITLNLSHNSFSGVFPSGIVNSRDLVELYVNNNDFIGEIPRQIGQISALRILHMQGNHFNGSIPLSFGFLRGIESLDLSANNLSNRIPDELQKLPFLVSLNLSFNHLDGQVPGEGVFKNTSQFSLIGNQNLCGGIPEIKLPTCFQAKNRGNTLSTKALLVMILSISIAFILVLVIVIIFRRKRSRREPINDIPEAPSMRFGCSRVSYKELLDATDGFSASNLIGEGGFGSVYKGILDQQENPIAVKVSNLQNLGALKSFGVECQALSKIRHRNLVKVITSCSSIDYKGNDFKAIVLEFMANGSLKKWLESDSLCYLSFGQVLDVALDVGNALDYLHHDCESIIVHRDLKPANVLLDEDMVAHVSDFGMAKILSDAASKPGFEKPTSSVINGTIGYVAPEYGMGGPTSPEGDIYSYGILLLEMISGKSPTDALFNDGSSLHGSCKMALIPSSPWLREIVDFRLLKQIKDQRNVNTNMDGDEIKWECLVAFINVGVACSVEVPFQRKKIKESIEELHAIKGLYHRIINQSTSWNSELE